MMLTRRSALLGGLSLPVLAMLDRGSLASTSLRSASDMLVVALTSVSAATKPAMLSALMEPFLARNLPVFLGVATVGPDGTPLVRTGELATFLRSTLERHPGLLEIGLDVTFRSQDPYEQLREASTAQATFGETINSFAPELRQEVLTALTLSTSASSASPKDGAVLRAAGIRTVLRIPGQDGTGDHKGFSLTSTGLANLYVPEATSARSATGRLRGADDLMSGLQSLYGRKHPLIVVLPLDAFASLQQDELASHAASLAAAVEAERAAGRVRLAHPQTLYTEMVGHSGQAVFIRIDDLRIAAADPEHMAFTTELMALGAPVIEAVIPMTSTISLSEDKQVAAYLRANIEKPGFEVAVHGWRHTPSEMLGLSREASIGLVARGAQEVHRTTGRTPFSFVPPNNMLDANALEGFAAAGLAIVSAQKNDFKWFSGLDRHGILHLSNTIMFEKSWTDDLPYQDTQAVLDRIGTKSDAVFSIHPRTANTPEKRKQVLDVVATLARRAGTPLKTFEAFGAPLMAMMPDYETIRRARGEVGVADPRPRDTSREEEARLREDAALAWRYFEWGAANFGGMVPSTGWFEDGTRQGYPFATMWDIASYILASISARRIGLIDDPAFAKRIDTILTFLGASSYSFGGARLPPTERRLGRLRGQRRGFDSADTGRLLVALKILDDYTGQSFHVAKLVTGWDLEAALADGEMHIISAGGKAVSAHKGSYANYVAKGYALWGYELKPVFEAASPDRSMDDAVSVLREIRSRGRIATEPQVTEEVELGPSPHGKLMADVLYAAQIARYRETGKLTCASEGPVNGSPYFTYQGYQLTENGGTWHIDASSDDKLAATLKRGEAIRAVSTKGSYLWYAARSGDYSTRLIAAVRERGRMPGLGFASGILEKTAGHTAVSDVNTNGIILEAIAYILNGCSPLSSMRLDNRVTGQR
jgi:peptidoglycan/xylan/chitin deacetylase (PgdA/CDA1 family)